MNDFLTASELAREMGTGESTVRFWLNRFSKWLPHVVDQGQNAYTRESLATLFVIAEKIDSGMLPTEIETHLDDRSFNAQKEAESLKKEADSVGKRSLDLVESLLGTMTTLQERMATAQERRTTAEEKKAMAMERRAEAEEKKALAMNAIATALKGMNQGMLPGSAGHVMVDATHAIAMDTLSALEPGPNMGELVKDTDDLSQLVADDSLDDLSQLVAEEKAPLDDLSLLVTEEKAPLDDLSLLVTEEKAPLDDLSLLVAEEKAPLDDLSLLVAEEKAPLDDLSLLVAEEKAPLDDLSLLVTEEKAPRDDLSLLLDNSPDKEKGGDRIALDDLGLLVTDEQNIRPTVTPEENFEQYKSEIINIIIRLKTEGLTVEETTKKFNSEGVLNLKGKPQWNSKAIAQIYKFIEAVKK
ncbi:MAG: MerR family transcriptional regulator [Desulfobacterium sp.]|nr:MerR family transcriptional regulator [Desulfobacterium sp.]